MPTLFIPELLVYTAPAPMPIFRLPVVFEFKERKSLTVVLNKSVKLPMTWNGKLYEGKMAGIDFTSAGPSINKTTSGRG